MAAMRVSAARLVRAVGEPQVRLEQRVSVEMGAPVVTGRRAPPGYRLAPVNPGVPVEGAVLADKVARVVPLRPAAQRVTVVRAVTVVMAATEPTRVR